MINFKNIWVIRNPVAGWKSLKQVDEMLDILSNKKRRLMVCNTLFSGHAGQLALKACEEQADLLVAAGGDGTLSEVINGLIAFQRQYEGAVPLLAIFPSGTVNLVAKELGVSGDPVAFVKLLVNGKERIIWPAKVNGRYFLTSVGIGFDAYIVNGVTACNKRKYSRLAYIFQACRLLAEKWQQSYEVSVDGERDCAAAVIAMNSRYYGGRFAPVGLAALTDPEIYLCIFKRSRRWDLFTYILYLLGSRLHKHKQVKIVSGGRIVVCGHEGQRVQVDGDIAAVLPVEISRGDIPVRIIGQ